MKTTHRRAARAKRELPKFWRPTLTAEQMSTCKLAHWDLIDRFTSGKATQADMMDWVETGLTYSELMRLLEADGTAFTDEARAAITDQMEAAVGVLDRFRTTGRVGFNSDQLLAARAAAEVMDQLIELDRFGFAVRAARWSIEKMRSIHGARAMN